MRYTDLRGEELPGKRALLLLNTYTYVLKHANSILFLAIIREFHKCLLVKRPSWILLMITHMENEVSLYIYIYIGICILIMSLYLQLGHPAGIPARADLIFEVELLKIN